MSEEKNAFQLMMESSLFRRAPVMYCSDLPENAKLGELRQLLKCKNHFYYNGEKWEFYDYGPLSSGECVPQCPAKNLVAGLAWGPG